MTQPPSSSAIANVGRVESVSNEICLISGLENIALNNIVEFSSGQRGMVLGFTKNETQVIILGDYQQITKGELVRVVAEGLQVNASPQLMGRVINPLGQSVDGMGSIEDSPTSRYFETNAKPVSQRAFIEQPLYTGFMAIDSQIPIGRGQRELLVGGKKVGKVDVAIEAICHQAQIKSGVIGIYVAVDTDSSSTKRRIQRLRETGALEQSVVIVARSSDPASLNYVAPMVGVSIAEAFAEQGKDVLLVFDNLTSHAKVYRQISLLLGRPAGREAYPGDIFYLHARLLERCGAFSQSAGGGSITALPLVETQNEEITDYVTTNLMSITDGHILFRQSLANKGIQPPIDSGFSVSRIGGRAQIPVMRTLSDNLRNTMIQFAEVERYLVFGTELRGDMKNTIEVGRRSQALFSQSFQDRLTAEIQILLIYLVVSQQILNWDEYQMTMVRKQILDFFTKEPHAQELADACHQETYQAAEPLLQQLAQAFISDSSTIKATPKPQASEAEKETIIDLLREGGEALRATGED